MANTEVEHQTTVDTTVKEPGLYKVIYVNDDTTSMEFVVQSLVEIFDYDEEVAYTITYDIHEKGSATVAVLPYEIAEQKGIEVTLSARSKGYPLQIKIEPNE